jgi:methionyl-tRNA formyltransferase
MSSATEENAPIKVLFIGTDKFGIPTLKALIQDDQYKVTAIISQPDAPVGRKRVMTPPDIKRFSKENYPDLRIYQPESISDAVNQILKEQQPDLIIVVAYGQIIPEEMIDYPKYNCLNIHGSLLPRYRGAVPIEAALLNDDKETGVSILQMTPRLDDGPVVAEKKYQISDEHNAIDLREELSEIGAELLLAKLPDWISGELMPVEQEVLGLQTGRKLSFAPVEMLSRENAQILYGTPVRQALKKVKAFAASRKAWCKVEYREKIYDLKIFDVEILKAHAKEPQGNPDVLALSKAKDKKLLLNLKEGQLKLHKVQLSGKEMRVSSEYLYLLGQ